MDCPNCNEEVKVNKVRKLWGKVFKIFEICIGCGSEYIAVNNIIYENDKRHSFEQNNFKRV